MSTPLTQYNRRRAAMAGHAAGLLVLSSFATGCRPTPTTPVAVAPPPPEVTCLRIHTTRAGEATELPGIVTAVRSTTLTAPEAGLVRFLPEEGALLKAGQQAVFLDAPGLTEQIGAARAAVDAAALRSLAAGTAVNQAERDAESALRLSEQDLKAAQAERDRRAAVLAETRVQASTEPARLQAQVAAAEARVRLLRSGEREQRLRQLEAELETAKAASELALTQLQRNRELYAQGYAARRDLEASSLTLKRARAEELKINEELKLQREGAHPEAILEGEANLLAAREALRASQGLTSLLAQRQAALEEAEAQVKRADQRTQEARSNRLAVTRARQDARATSAEMRRTRLQLEETAGRMRRTAVPAPFSGQVVQRLAQPGQGVVAGAPLLRLVDPSALLLEVSVPEQELGRLKEGMLVQVRIPSALSAPLRSRVSQVIQSTEGTSREYRARIPLAVGTAVKSGMAGTVSLAAVRKSTPPLVPLQALRAHFPREGRAELLVVEHGRLALRPVKVGELVGTELPVVSGLKEADHIVLPPWTGLEPGQSVRIRESRP